MKSHFYLLLFAAMLLASCTNDDAQSHGKALLVKKLTQTMHDLGPDAAVNEYVFNYVDNVLVSTVSGTPGGGIFTTKYRYNGSKITKAEYFLDDATVPTSSRTITYDGDYLKYIIDDAGSYKQELFYTEGKLSRQNFYFSAVNENNPINLGVQYNYTFNNGNISQQTYQDYSGGISSFTTTFVYDSKNNLMKNMNPYLKFFFIEQGFNPFTQNNIIASADTFQGSLTPTEYVYDIIYNDDNYPVKITKSYKESHQVVLVVDVEYL